MKRLVVAAAAASLASVLLAPAAPPMGGSNPSSAAMERLAKVYKNMSFSATAVVTIEGGAASGKKFGGAPGPMEFLMTISEGKTRTEMDFAKMAGGKAGAMPPGFDKIIAISRPDKKFIYQIMPGMQAYAEMAIPEATPGQAAKDVTIDRKSQGTETIENYSCEKVLNTVTAADGTKTEVLTWEAKELKGMPIKMQTEVADGKVTTLFKDIKTAKPPDSVFEPQAGYTKYGSMQEMMMSGAMKMMPKGM